MAKSATISDIARASGFSASTVSLVINRKPGISSQTRERVLQAAKSVGYNLESRRQPRQELSTIGLVLKVFEEQLSSSNPFYSVVIAGIEHECQQQGIQLLYSHLRVDLHNCALEVPGLVNNKDIDGLLLIGLFLDKQLGTIIQSKTFPVVLVDAYSATDIFDTVNTRNFDGAYAAVSYLIKRGHQYIGMVGASPDIHPSFDQRRYGYRQALLDHQIERSYFTGCVVHVSGDDFYRGARELLEKHPEITALFCAADVMAIEAIRAAHDLCLHIPDDLSIVGFDDIDISSYITPPLTTCQVDKSGMGRLAVRVLQQRLQLPSFPPITHSLAVKLVERQSVADNSRG